MESRSVKTPVLHHGVFQAKPLSTNTNSVYLFFLDQSRSINKIFAIVKNNKKCSNACNSPEEDIRQGFCPSVTCWYERDNASFVDATSCQLYKHNFILNFTSMSIGKKYKTLLRFKPRVSTLHASINHQLWNPKNLLPLWQVPSNTEATDQRPHC